MRFTNFVTVAILALAVMPCTHGWLTSSFFAPALRYNMMDDGFGNCHPRAGMPIAILTDADRSFRQLDNFVDNVVEAFTGEDENPSSTRMRLKEAGGNSTDLAAKHLEMRLKPSFEWKETEHGFVLTAATPGLRKEDINVEIVEAPKKGGYYLIVSGESRVEEKQGDDKTEIMAIRTSYKKFEQRVKLPESVDKDTLTAKYDDGILQVHVAAAKKQDAIEPPPERKRITIA